MTTSSLFSVLAPTTVSTLEGTATAAEPKDQGFSHIYTEQSAQLEPEQGAQASVMESAMTQTMEQQSGEHLPYGLPLGGQSLAYDEAALPVLSEVDSQAEDTALPQLTVTQVPLFASLSAGEADQGSELLAKIEQESNPLSVEFERLMQQRQSSPELQRVINSEVGVDGAQVEAVSSSVNLVQSGALQPQLNKLQTSASEEKSLNQSLALEPISESQTLDETAVDMADEGVQASRTSEYVRPLLLGGTNTEKASPELSMIPLNETVDGVPDDGLNDLKVQIAEPKAEPFSAQRAQQQEQTLRNQASQDLTQKIDVTPKDNRWTEVISERIAIMNAENIQSARIQLDPPELGSLEIKIRVQQDQVSVAFNSGHQVVRDALDAQSNRLRELMESQGIHLAEVNVSDQSTQQGQQGGGSQTKGNPEAMADGNGDDEHGDASAQASWGSNNLVDDFA